MSWRTVIISKRAKLDLQLGYLVVRAEEVRKVHLSEISVLIIESTEVSLTAALMAEMTKQKIKVIFCDEKRNPCSELVSYYGAVDTSNKIRLQINWQEDVKKAVWTEIARQKIDNQRKTLAIVGREENLLLKSYLDEIEPGDASNREGHAAKVYFNALFGKGFSRADAIPINAALNYGYGILLSACNREITANGYITQLGVHHCNVYNQFNLGSDLMEIFRPFVDIVVYRMVQKELLEDFEKDEKRILVNVLNETIMCNGQRQIVNNAVKIYCKSIFDALNDKDISLIKNCTFIEG